MRRETFSTPEPPRVDIRVAAGEVDVTTGDGDETVVTLEPLNGRGAEAIETASISFTGDRLDVDVDVKRAGLGWGWRNPRVRVTVQAPHGSTLAVRSAAADLSARGRYADAAVQSAAGDVAVDEVDNRLDVRAVSGDVKVQRVGGDADVTTVSGDMRIDEVGGNVRWDTVSGEVAIAAIGGATIDAHSVSGDMRLGVRRGSSVFLDVRTMSGETSSELEAVDGPPADAPTVELRAVSLSGDVRIVRA